MNLHQNKLNAAAAEAERVREEYENKLHNREGTISRISWYIHYCMRSSTSDKTIRQHDNVQGTYLVDSSVQCTYF